MTTGAKQDYKNTVFLPQTDFPMRGGLPEAEPKHLARWEKIGVTKRKIEATKNAPKYILHWGPPYANGPIHIGHALTYLLKDFVCRYQGMLGKAAVPRQGWDCHGLPIEWKIEEQYRKDGRDKNEVDIVAFRQECRAFAEKWIDVQREELKRLGIEGRWEDPYLTMSFASQATIMNEIGKFLLNGDLYKGLRSVYWSVVEQTALADAEIEYRDHTSTTIYVRFPIVKSSRDDLKDAAIVIWTTTPWSMPGNRALAYGPEMDYVLLQITTVKEGSLAKAGSKILLAKELVESFCAEIGIADHKILANLKGDDLAGIVCHHPLHGKGYDYDVPLLPADFVTADQGTGFVHIAPSHGVDDFNLGQQHGLDVPDTLTDDGIYRGSVPLFAGMHVFKVNDAVCEAMTEAGNLLAKGSIVHSYPHSWRSKAPIIFRATPQWFIPVDSNGLRQKCLAEIKKTKWIPSVGENRITAMLESRPDWCISRQRAWGVPIAIFVHRDTGEPLRDAKVVARIVEIFQQEGADSWYSSPPQRFLGDDYDAADYDQVKDVVDVWFDSGCTHAYVLENDPAAHWPADLYFEGSDQHRGWFQSSLLQSCGTRNVAPYKAVATHGYVLNEAGEKMSKSVGNAIGPQEITDQFGADILRLVVANADFTGDVRLGRDVLKHQTDLYRRIRNTFRFMLGSLAGFDYGKDKVAVDQMPALEQLMLHQLAALDQDIRDAIERLDFIAIATKLHNFCNIDLSAFYFDIRKDRLYCDALDDPKRRATQTVLHHLFECLAIWIAPILAFTADEAWQHRYGDENDSVHLHQFPDIPVSWRQDELAARWEKLRDLRRVMTGALEIKRKDKMIGSSLQARIDLYLDGSYDDVIKDIDLAELAIASAVTVKKEAAPKDAFTLEDVKNVAAVVAMAEGAKCERCWMVLPDVGTHDHAGLCARCDDVVAGMPEAPIAAGAAS